MILGIGTDIIEIQRVAKAVERNSNFLERNFSKQEIAYFKTRNLKYETIAGNFAAKEAISKAIGTGFRGFGLKDINILRDDLGKPFVLVSKTVEDIIKEKSSYLYKIHISISHNKENAIAYAILEGDV
ncbi:MAG: holo-ACP synthase [Sarcina sp.]